MNREHGGSGDTAGPAMAAPYCSDRHSDAVISDSLIVRFGLLGAPLERDEGEDG